ncbi:MAG: hypothetical protein ABW189_00610 [Rickettsiales bacterium]
MDLKQFIALTINEVCAGVHKARDEQGKAAVAPAVLYYPNSATRGVVEVSHIKFDLAVQHAQGPDGKARLSVSGNGPNAGGEGANRLEFNVPVYFQGKMEG